MYAISGVSAYHIANGVEESLTLAGPQTLSLLMVPTSSPFADQTVDPQTGSPEEDFYLHLHLPPELDLPLPATTQIYHQPPSSYLIPRWDLGRNSGAFTKIEFPAVGSRKGLQEDVDTFETILAQCTAFLERAPPPQTSKSAKLDRTDKPGKSDKDRKSSRLSPTSSRTKSAMSEELPAYNPADFKPGEAYVKGSHSSYTGGQIVLVDEEDGSVIGELGDGFQIVEDSALKPGSKGERRKLQVLHVSRRALLSVFPARPCGDHAPDRPQPTYWRGARLAGVCRSDDAPSLPGLVPSIPCLSSIAFHRDDVGLCIQGAPEPG